MLFIFKILIISNCLFFLFLEVMDFKSFYFFKFENFNIKGYVGGGGFKENIDICVLIFL